MPLSTLRRLGAVAVLTLTALAGCLDAVGNDDQDEPDIFGVVITASLASTASGTTTAVPGTQTGALTLRAGVPNALTVRVLARDGQDDAVIMQHSDEFEVWLMRNDQALPSTIDGGYPYAFSVTPDASVTGTLDFEVQVYSTEHGHAEGPRIPLQITVVAQ